MTRTTQPWLRKLKVFKDEKGLTLVESLVTVAIVGVVLAAFAVALSTGSLAVRESDQEVTVAEPGTNSDGVYQRLSL